MEDVSLLFDPGFDRCFISTESTTVDLQTNKPNMTKPWMEFATSETMKKLVEFMSKIHETASIDHVSPKIGGRTVYKWIF